jgi:SAM-dependent methyltransferase
MSSTDVPVLVDNDEAISAWDGVLFDRWLKYRHIYVGGLANHGDEALRLFGPKTGWRVIDVGCGLGDTTQAIAQVIGPTGEAVGVDAAAKMLEIARRETAELDIANARFDVADVQLDPLGDGFDMAFSRMGTMFFANPVAALRNVRSALKPGAALVMVVWRRREDNPWVWEAQQVVERMLGRPEEYDQPTCGPGPFSMANADTVSDQLMYAGFAAPTFRRCDLPILLGRDDEEAVDIAVALGPAAEIIRLWGDRMAHRHDEVRAALREVISGFAREDGSIHALASTWIVSATNPG